MRQCQMRRQRLIQTAARDSTAAGRAGSAARSSRSRSASRAMPCRCGASQSRTRGDQRRVGQIRPAGIWFDPSHQCDAGAELLRPHRWFQRFQALRRDRVGQQIGDIRRIDRHGAVAQHQRAQAGGGGARERSRTPGRTRPRPVRSRGRRAPPADCRHRAARRGGCARRLSRPARRRPAAARWRACRCAAFGRRRRRRSGTTRLAAALADAVRERRRRAAGPGRHRPRRSAGNRSRRRYWPAVRRMRDSAPRSASGSPWRIASSRVPMSAGRCRASAAGRAPPAARRGRRRAPVRPGFPPPASSPPAADAPRCDAMRWPAGVMRPSVRAPSSVSNAAAAVSAPGGGWSWNFSVAGGVPQAAQSSTRRGKFGLQNFRPVEWRQAAMLRRRPQPDGDAGRLAAGAAGALIGGGAGHAHRRQPGQAGRRIQPRHAAASRHR